ncbi:unnamed protein product [Prorocentrum cordatum]|uniref:Uncharacterized protein n=1 Tax=Prorocentrum cordatum TaxID=2364126 RepID=A0ABN9V1D4_9DINO|nr:unnamed protein product [Polarella glacialis]
MVAKQAAAKESPPKHFRSLAIEDQISKLNQRADKLATKHQQRALQVLLKDRPDLIPGIVKHLSSKGVQLPDLKTFGNKGARIPDDDDMGTGSGDFPAIEDKALPAKVRRTTAVRDDNPDNWLPHKYTKLVNCSPKFLEELASKLEDISYSTYMLKALKVKRQTKEHHQEKLAEIIEFASGWDMNKAIVGDMRHIPTFTKQLQEASVSRGNRGATLRLPATWTEKGVGVYSFVGGAGMAMVVRNRFNDISVEVPESMFLKVDGQLAPFDELFISDNYSETRAAITTGKSTESIAIATLAGAGAAMEAEAYSPSGKSGGITPQICDRGVQ